jgi:hypothetical protein
MSYPPLPISDLRLALQAYLEAGSELVQDWDFIEDQPLPSQGVVGELMGQLYVHPEPYPVGYSELQPVISVQLKVSSLDYGLAKTLMEDAIAETQLLLDAFNEPSYVRPSTPWVTSEMGRTQRPDGVAGFLYHLMAGCSVVGSVKSQTRINDL